MLRRLGDEIDLVHRVTSTNTGLGLDGLCQTPSSVNAQKMRNRSEVPVNSSGLLKVVVRNSGAGSSPSTGIEYAMGSDSIS